jgi:hypothetical protein
MTSSRQPVRSHLFALRVWRVVLDDGTTEWRGAIEYLASHEKRYFRDWSVIQDFVQQELQATRDDDFRLSSKKSDSE